MPRLIPGLAILLAYAITPGSGEITENAFHLLTNGHGAHALGEEDHGPADEHGCSGPFEVCPCHGSGAFIVARTQVEVETAQPVAARVRWFLADLRADGVRTDFFRPPIA